MTDRGPHLAETEARQGQTGAGVRWVLRIALVLVVIGFAVIWALYARPLSGHAGQTEAPANVAQSVRTTPNAVKEAAATAPPGSVTAQAAGRQEQTTGG